ncbi:hypothetical protein LQK89_16840 (plasmid) [Curtobacterium sp. C1]|jgi:hypothetical protein|uniref:hypothetical protein n=1 Tax=Curtobacterium sp. C1 TaxID=2898151 RepID=UPI001E525B58|nr:hypothetical protein [Curtobacterium sp. C1]UFU15944.1 hypothetical protein LQK89_16840 [Curtobacterium sp. C1]
MTSTSDRVSDPIDQVRRAVEAYRQSRQARDDAIADAAIALGREAAAEASGLSLSRIQQLVSDRTRTTNATRRSA